MDKARNSASVIIQYGIILSDIKLSSLASSDTRRLLGPTDE
jgi:hypothetical protein